MNATVDATWIRVAVAVEVEDPRGRTAASRGADAALRDVVSLLQPGRHYTTLEVATLAAELCDLSRYTLRNTLRDEPPLGLTQISAGRRLRWLRSDRDGR